MKKSDFGKLMRSINTNMTKYISKNMEVYGVKYGQMDYFLMISRNPGINQLDVAKASNVGKASVTKAIKILEVQGYVRREIDLRDRRNVKCFVTEKGQRYSLEILQLKSKVEKDLFEGFSKEELDLFYSYMNRLNKNAESLDVIE